MAKSRPSIQKRLREKNRMEKNAMKRERRAQRSEEGDEEEVDPDALTEDQLYEQFALLNQRFAEKEIDQETFEKKRAEIYEQLGIEVDV